MPPMTITAAHPINTNVTVLSDFSVSSAVSSVSAFSLVVEAVAAAVVGTAPEAFVPNVVESEYVLSKSVLSM